MASGHSGWSFWKASAMAERSASTQTVILAVGSCATVGKPYVPAVPELAGALGPIVGPLLGVPEAAVPVGAARGEPPPQAVTSSVMQAAAADTPVNVRGALR